jgi:hypothetical protein
MGVALFERREKECGKKVLIGETALKRMDERHDALVTRRGPDQMHEPLNVRTQIDLVRVNPNVGSHGST